jgi:hypothetical protein
MHLLCAAAVGLAACGSKDDLTNLANTAANTANTAANAATNAANTAETAANAATNAANTGETVTNAADEAGGAVTNAADASGGAYGKAVGGPVAGQGGKGPPPRIKLNVKKVWFVGCTRLAKAAKPGSCLIVRSGYGTYDISSAKPRPNLGRVITGTGLYLPNQHGICMAGKVLSGVKWDYTKGHCEKG